MLSGHTKAICTAKVRRCRMITMQEMEQELAVYRKSFTAVRLIGEEEIRRSIQLREEHGGKCVCPCKDGPLNGHDCRSCVVMRAYQEKGKKIKLEYAQQAVYQVTARYLYVDGRRYVLELVQKLDEEMMIDPESGEMLANRLISFEEKLYHDALTGAYNRRYYEERMCRKIFNAGVAMIDVDNFKLYNDIFGHRAGDVVLETMARVVQEHTAAGDMLVRLGGDEFLLVMPGLPQEKLYRRLNDIREEVHAANVPGYTNLQISISIGGVNGAGRTLEVAALQADKLMYQAKGRQNMVVTDTMLEQSPETARKLRSERERILIVDDSEMNRAILSEMLSEEYEILEASNGKECMDIITDSRQRISLMLLDLVMPIMDGFEVLAAMNRSHLIENLPVIMISSEDNDSLIRRAYEQGVSDYINRPFDAKVVYRRVFNTIKLYAKQRRLISMVTSEIMEKEKNNMMMVTILSHIVEFRNGESGQHVINIRKITEHILETLCARTDRYGLTPQKCAMIVTASAMHDVGKIAIDSEILNKPGRLTKEEFEIMKTHTTIGAQMLNELEVYRKEQMVQMAYDICRWHHERYDGKGYPDGLKGDEIPISAQVVSLADVYDALTSPRVYKPPFTHEKAIEMIMNGECGTFNPILLECLKEVQDTLKTELQDVFSEGVKQELPSTLLKSHIEPGALNGGKAE